MKNSSHEMTSERLPGMRDPFLEVWCQEKGMIVRRKVKGQTALLAWLCPSMVGWTDSNQRPLDPSQCATKLRHHPLLLTFSMRRYSIYFTHRFSGQVTFVAMPYIRQGAQTAGAVPPSFDGDCPTGLTSQRGL